MGVQLGQSLVPHPLAGLLQPGQRLGWQYDDRVPRPFPHAQPVAPPPAQPGFDAAGAGKAMWRRLLVSGGLGVGLTVMVGCCGFFANGPRGSTGVGSSLTLMAVLLGVGTAALIVWIVTGHQRAKARAAGLSGAPYRAYQQVLSAWQRDAAAFDAAEAARVAALPQWLSAGPRPEVTRVDVVGGNQWGWEALLTVAGAGYLATHGPSTIVDLTGDAVCRDLHGLAVSCGIAADLQIAPGNCDLLDGLSTADLVEVLVEAVHGDGDRTVRADRATDDRILTAISTALGDAVTLARIADGVQTLLRVPAAGATLTAAERTHIRDELFTPESLIHLTGALHRLDAYLHPLRTLTSTPRPDATLTILATAGIGASARSELLNDLIVAWLTRRVATRPDTCRTLVIAGADYLPERHVERLSGVCTRRGVRLVLLWRHLRDTAQRALGTGTVAFMRLGSAEEATRAADYIGRQHRFVLSSLTRTTGGSTTLTESTGYSEAITSGTTRGTTLSGSMHDLLRTAHAWSRAEQASHGRTVTNSTGTATASSSNWSDAVGEQRVYEYAIEPATLQGLPEYAILLVDHTPSGVRVQALDCNPGIVTLPGVRMQPATAANPPTATSGPYGYAQPVAPALDYTPPEPWQPQQPPAPQRIPIQRTEGWTGQDPPR